MTRSHQAPAQETGKSTQRAAARTGPVLECRGIQIAFGGVIAADGVDIAIEEGENLAIIGPNGAGKTTFLNICTGYLKPSAGSVTFEGRDITRRSPRGITRLGIARAFQIPQLFSEHTTLQNMLIAAAARDRIWNPLLPMERMDAREEMLALLDLLGVAAVADRLIGELPEGTRKLIDIALALALEPKLLFMDEPTSGVASSEKFDIMDILVNALQHRQVTAVFVEHDMEVVERYADRVAVWNGGRIQKIGSVDDVLNDPDVRRDVIGV
ncbi:MAG: ABC transporter ATP-binding protein [Geminicoccaceae bacterium]